uniref:Uncharacterized protein n=1 Tax=Leersia perrieri TaxID=77586 RepID=A0A0D9X2Q7_9ORYZ
MATLQSSLFSSSPATAFSSRMSRPVTSPAILPVASRRDRCFPSLKMTQPRKTLTTTVQCQKKSDASNYLHEEKEKCMDYYNEIMAVDHGCLYADAAEMSARVCMAAKDALVLASHVMKNAELNLAAPNEVSAETIHRTVKMYVDVFTAAADDSYGKKVSKDTMTSFLVALRGLAAVSHILLNDALEAVSHRLPRYSLSQYAFNSDVKAMYEDFELQMNEIEFNVNDASVAEICQIAFPLILIATGITGTIVGLMLNRRKISLEKSRAKLAACA